eukprot:3816666-Prymnesium_polylepis.1
MAVETLGRLASEDLAMHTAALASKLEDADAGVRVAVAKTFSKLAPHDLATQAAALAAKLEDADAVVRVAVVETLGGH